MEWWNICYLNVICASFFGEFCELRDRVAYGLGAGERVKEKNC